MGRFQDELPPPSGRRVVKYDWYKVCAAARKRPGEWYLAFNSATSEQARTVRRRDATALKADDGKFIASIRNSRRHGSTWRGELWLMFVPSDTPPDSDTNELLAMQKRGDL